MKATRYEYMLHVDDWLKKNEFCKDHILEISGTTPEWQKFFKQKTVTSFPEVDAHDMPYDDNTYDCVAFNQILEHVEKPWICVKEAHRVLKPGGIAILCSPFMYQVHHHPRDFWRFTVCGLEALCEDFSTIELKRKAGNAKMVSHMIAHPEDRGSSQFNSVAYLPLESQKKYYSQSIIIARK